MKRMRKAVKCVRSSVKRKLGFSDEAKLLWVVRCHRDGEELQTDLIKMTEYQEQGMQAPA